MKKVSCSLRVLGIFAILFLIGCGNFGSIGGEGDGSNDSATLVSITVTPPNPSISVGANPQFTATGTYSDATTKKITTSVTWRSSDTGVATISNATGSKGLATAMRAGSTTIEATLGDISGETAMTVTSALPRTGQTSPYGVGDDGELIKGVAWPDPRFTAGSGAEADCITDNLTGLMWAKSPDSIKRTWADALAYANDLDPCGHTDWRLPNKEELRSLINYAQLSSVIWLGEAGFRNVKADSYWSSSTYASVTDLAWSFNLEDGSVGAPDKGGTYYVWAVRSGQSGVVELHQTGQTESLAAGDDGDLEKGGAWPDPRFTAGSGAEADCITDNLTGLMWAKSSGSGDMLWDDALAYANDLDLCGHIDWRLPNINELESLVHAGVSDTVSWLNGQGFTVDTFDYWTSTTYALVLSRAWYIGITDGYIGTADKSEDFNVFGYALPVRSVQ